MAEQAYRPRRSVLYMPSSNERALEKAKTLPVDALILDLEDAVAPDSKEAARANDLHVCLNRNLLGRTSHERLVIDSRDCD